MKDDLQRLRIAAARFAELKRSVGRLLAGGDCGRPVEAKGLWLEKDPASCKESSLLAWGERLLREKGPR